MTDVEKASYEQERMLANRWREAHFRDCREIHALRAQMKALLEKIEAICGAS